jgi:biopolymer transport protein ExbB/TolQ
VGIFYSIIENFKAEPLFMWSILVTFVVGMAIAAERLLYVHKASGLDKDDFMNRVNQQILRGNLPSAIQVCMQTENPLTNIVKAGLVAVANKKSAEEVQTAMDAVALREIPRIEKRTSLLALMSNLATLIGLLGTIAGLIEAFKAAAGASPEQKAVMLSNSISLAMNCTAFGLFAAIPLLAVYGYIQTRATETVDDIHEVAVQTLNFIISNREKFKG